MNAATWWALSYGWNCLIQMMGDIACGPDGKLTDEAAQYLGDRFTEGLRLYAEIEAREPA